MDRPVRQRLPHAIPSWVDERSFFFITICCAKRGVNQLCQPEIASTVLRSAAFYHEQQKWHCRLFLLMPDHAHGILAFPRDPGMRSLMKAWKGYQARCHGIAWQTDFFDHRLRDQVQMDETIDYVLNNPVRAGLCARPEEWPHVYRPMDRLM